MQLKKLSYLFKYVPDQYKTQQMCNKAILEHGGTLKFVPDYYKNQEMSSKAMDNYYHTLEFVPKCYKTCVIKLSVFILFTTKMVPEL